MSKAREVYDVESFQNFVSFIFRDLKTKELHKYVIFADKQNDSRSVNDLPRLVKHLEREIEVLIGYNSEAYDDILAMHLVSHSKRLSKSHPSAIAMEVYRLSQTLIAAQKEDRTPQEVYLLRKKSKPWRCMDLLLQFNTIDRVGLKQLAINMRWPVVQDLPIDPHSIVLYDQIPDILKYELNDVDITERLLGELAEPINNRILYSNKYDTDIINSCDSDVGKKIIAHYYEQATGVSYNTFKEWRTYYHRLHLADCIAPKIHFESREYQRILEKTGNTIIDPNKKEEKGKKKKKQFELILRSKYLTHTMGLGGLHSNNPAEILEENDKYLYIDLDVASYYPWLIINEGLYPAHLGPAFIPVYEHKIVRERMRIKKLDPVLAYMLKIAANAAFGLTKSKHSWMYDPKVTTTTCVSGELYLFMLMEALELKTDCMVVYSNTDGLTVRVPRDQVNRFHQICKQWELYTGFELEFNRYKRMIMRDVNNYMMFTYSNDPDKHIKAKGAYLKKRPIHKGYVYPIIPQAIENYFDKGVPVQDTILGCQDVYEFLKAERTSVKKFDVQLLRAGQDSEYLQKNNRWIVSKGNEREGKLYKISKEDQSRTEMQSGYFVTPLNTIDNNVPIEAYKINYEFYINEALSMIHLTQELNKETHLQDEYVQQELFA